MTKEEAIALVKEYKVYKSDNTLNSYAINKLFREHDMSDLDGDNPNEKIYLLFNERPFCPVCGKPLVFRAGGRGYPKTCSKECKDKAVGIFFHEHKDEIYTDETIQKRKQTCLDKYGCENPSQNEDVKAKRASTNLDKYGCENVFSNKEIQQQIRETNLKNLGVENPSKSPEIQAIISEKNKAIFNNDDGKNPLIQQIQNTNLDRYGFKTALQNPDIRAKVDETKELRYGDSKYNNIEKGKQTRLTKYGNENMFKTDHLKKVSKETCLNKYGVPYSCQAESVKRKIHSKHGASKPEKLLESFLINRKFNFTYQYSCENKMFDFAIFKNDELSILIEIDGEFNHGLKSDPDCSLVNGLTDCSRFSKVPDGVKFIVCDSLRVEDCFEEILRVFDINYEDWIQEIVDSLPREFPYPEYSEDRLRSDYKHLCEYDKIKKRSRIADSTIRQFHKSIWHSHLYEKPSPYDAWYNRDLLEKCVRNRFIYSSNLSSQSIVNGFNVCKVAPKVSVFSASLAKYLIVRYLNDYDTVFDPFSGFSGRMLGTCACGKHYIGQDISEEHVRESNDIIQFHNLNANVRVQDILTDTGGEYDCLFTCSPYGNKEIWGNELVFKSCDNWIDNCLTKYKCKRYLFVVNETNKYKDCIVEEIINTSHIGDSKEYVLCIDTKE